MESVMKMDEPLDIGLSLSGLFFDGPTSNSLKENKPLKHWLHAPAPCISEIPMTQDLQKELLKVTLPADAQKAKKFTPPFRKSNQTEKNPSGINTSQGGSNVIPNTGNAAVRNVNFSWLSHNDDENTIASFLQHEKILDGFDEEESLFKKSLFKEPKPLSEDKHTLSDTAEAVTSSGASHKESIVDTVSHHHLSRPPAFNLFNNNDDFIQNDFMNEGKYSVPATVRFLSKKGDAPHGILRPVTEIPKQFRNVFKEFPYFNYIQSKAMDELLYSDKNFVICAPTGSGKTVIFELSIIRLLVEAPMPWTNIKVVYMAPIKALCGQRFDDWKEKFGPIGLNCKELTGDTQIDDLFEIQHAHIIMTTPEKWDSMTRKWRDNTLVQLVRLFLIDEVHTVKDENRGATLEVVVSRMKTIQSSLSRVYKQAEVLVPMRFVAVSATIPNAEDIAEWLSDGRHSAVCMKIDETHRPVKLRKVVLGFPCTGNQTEFKFDLSLNYKIAGVIQTYSDQKPTLVFCATRKGVQQAASVLAKDAKFIMSIEHKQRLQKSANAIKDAKLRDLLTYGVGYHHAGVDISDRKVIEAAFTKGDLPVLFTTSTLAMGVNLPAHLVIIKSTMHYASGMYQEYSETDILQMIGRAGRPQFDTTATAVIMTRLHTREKYVQMLDGADTIESSLHKHLIEHLNAEVTLHTITDVNIALEWIRSTFLYIRALKNPTHYGFQKGLNKTGIEAKLQELCLKNLNDLSSVGLIKMDEETNFKPTETGKLMALYYIAFDTAKLFQRINGKETLPEMITMIAACSEFSDVQLRTSEKRLLNTLNKDKNRITIRYPMEGKIKSREMKVNCLIQAQFGCIPVQDFSLTQDIAKIFRHGTRITKCLSEFMALQEKKFIAFLNSLILTKCFRSKLWENSLHVSKQLEKIGVTLANAMVNSGLTSFKKIEDTNPREIEMIVNRHPPFGNQIKEAVTYLPKYEIGFEQITRYSQTIAEVVATVVLKNFEQLQKKRTAPVSHYVTLLIGDADNEVVFKQKIMDSALIKTGTWTKKIEIKRAFKSEELSINLISSDYVGLDNQQKFCVFYLGPKMFSSDMVDQGKAEDTLLKGKYDSGKIIHNAGMSSGQAVINTGMRACSHHCKNKDLCGHDCCKIGVSHKVDIKTDTNVSLYLNDLRSRNSGSLAPPVKRLKMQMINEANKNMNLQKYVFTPKTSKTSCTWSPYLQSPPQTLKLPNSTDIMRHYNEHAQDGANFKSSDNLGSKKSQTATSKKTTINSSLTNLTDADKSSCCSTKNLEVTFELGTVWDNFDDDILLDASSFTMETSALGSKNVSFSEFHSTPAFLPSAEQKEQAWSNSVSSKVHSHMNTGTGYHFSKKLPLKNLQQINDRLCDNYTAVTKEDEHFHTFHSEEIKTATGGSLANLKASHSNDFFFVPQDNGKVHGSDTYLDDEATAFIGIFDGIF